MRVIEIRHVETCFDGSFIKEITFSASITKNFIEHLSSLGRLEYFGSFPRPFYRIRDTRRFELKGVEGETTARLRVIAESEQFLAALSDHTGRYEARSSMEGASGSTS
jgi:hypothetical protein